jgi:hypothetical protein
MEGLEERAFLSAAAPAAVETAQPLTETALVVSPLRQSTADVNLSRKISAATRAKSPYAGTYIGMFNVRYWDLTNPKKPVQRSRGFRVTITLRELGKALGTSALQITRVLVSDRWFGAQRTTTPRFGSVATLPSPPRNLSISSGQGIVILFPNGATLGTANMKGQLHTSSDGRTISNALGVKESWTAVKNGKSFISVPHRIIKQTWALNRSAL